MNDGGACGWPPLSLALLRGDAYIDTVHLLLEGHADVEGSPMNLATTPLLLAAAYPHRVDHSTCNAVSRLALPPSSRFSHQLRAKSRLGQYAAGSVPECATASHAIHCEISTGRSRRPDRPHVVCSLAAGCYGAARVQAACQQGEGEGEWRVRVCGLLLSKEPS